AITEVEELSGRKLLDGEKIIIPSDGNKGADVYVSTSSAGGGLQMMVAGAVKAMTGESAQRCALGAGAIVMDVLASNDGRADYEKIERIRQLRPDMILLSGGTDGGTVTHVVELGQFIKAADPKPRLGASYKLPIIYAGNNKARDQIKGLLGDNMALIISDNIRPTLERENLMPARHKIHDIFLEHVMQQAPGYPKLMDMVSAPIMPTPAAVGTMTQKFAKANNYDVLAVDIGGATTDVFSVFSEIFNRTVSANLGMSYSISNVMAEAGLANILRWLPFDIDEQDLRNRLKNKMVRPTTIPQTIESLQVEHAVAREALRLAFDQHKALAVGLKGVQQERSISDAFEQAGSGQTLINLMSLNYIIGSGGILAHSPRRTQSMLLMMDAYQPEGITAIAVDSIFMMPHLGVLAQINEQAALDVFYKDCLVRIGTCVAPKGIAKENENIMEWDMVEEGGKKHSGTLRYGEIIKIPMEGNAQLTAKPVKGFDLGAGPGNKISKKVEGGTVGIVLDGRGRPLSLPKSHAKRIENLNKWYKAMEIYPA
ncbi:MAG: glutamate mutase L, partial [Elusimicrobiales bacterium]|nr:glutamate mutase L [Elusimicrobiales bacterium]